MRVARIATRSTVAAALVIAPILALSLAGPALASSTVVVTPGNLHDWAPQVTSTDGSVTFVTGPASPPLGTGSVRLFTGTHGDGAAAIRNTDYAGTRLSNLTTLSYWTYDTTNNGQQFPFLGLNVATSGSGAPDDTLFFEPPYSSPGNGGADCDNQATTSMNTWQQWNALTGCWWDNNGDLNPGTESGTLADYIALHPNAAIENTSPDGLGGVRLLVGEGSESDVFDGNVDAFAIGVNDNTTTYDFEHNLPPPPPGPTGVANPPTPCVAGDYQTSKKSDITFDKTHSHLWCSLHTNARSPRGVNVGDRCWYGNTRMKVIQFTTYRNGDALLQCD
jgi:hypothetical protein